MFAFLVHLTAYKNLFHLDYFLIYREPIDQDVSIHAVANVVYSRDEGAG